jgi:signal-transduction protein with cAMP-binding, CBS, and nucleotidyltransferase domain
MPLIPDKAAFQNSLASLPLVTYQPGETVIVAGSKTERLLILKTGAVAVVKDDTEIAQVAEPGAVFGPLPELQRAKVWRRIRVGAERRSLRAQKSGAHHRRRKSLRRCAIREVYER